MNLSRNEYIPALKYDWLTSLYDPILRWSLREMAFKRHLVEQADIQDGHQVLDLGCGTATLTVLIKQRHPDAVVFGLDADPRVLDIARRKVRQAGLKIGLHQCLAFDAPFLSGFFERVVSSLFFHHLTLENKRRTLEEIHRILKPEGEVHIADWGRPRNLLMRIAFLPVQILDGFQTTADSVNGMLPDLMRETGFEDVRTTAEYNTFLGTLSLYSGRKAGWQPESQACGL